MTPRELGLDPERAGLVLILIVALAVVGTGAVVASVALPGASGGDQADQQPPEPEAVGTETGTESAGTTNGTETAAVADVATTAAQATPTTSAPATQEPSDDPAASVRLSPERAQVQSGGATTFDVVVEGADGGVGAWNLTVAIGTVEVATLTDVELAGDPAQASKRVLGTNAKSTVDVRATGAETAQSGTVTVATVTVSGETAGTAAVSVSVDALATASGEAYTVTGTSGATVTVE